MLDFHALILFVPAMLAIVFAPGPDMLFVLAQSARGVRRGLVAVVGIISGGIVHIGAASIGLSAPQFVEPARGNVGWQIAKLGLIWYATGALVLCAVAIAGGRFDAWRRRNPRVRRVERYVTGTIFVGLGARVAMP